MDRSVKDPSEDAFTKLGLRHAERPLWSRSGERVYPALVKVDFGRFFLKFARDAVECDFIVNVPVIKTHAQCMVSLGIRISRTPRSSLSQEVPQHGSGVRP